MMITMMIMQNDVINVSIKPGFNKSGRLCVAQLGQVIGFCLWFEAKSRYIPSSLKNQVLSQAEVFEEIRLNLLEDVFFVHAVDSGPIGLTLVEIFKQLYLKLKDEIETGKFFLHNTDTLIFRLVCARTIFLFRDHFVV